MSRIGYQEVNESDEGRFVLMSQYLRKVMNAFKKTNKPQADQQAAENYEGMEPKSTTTVTRKTRGAQQVNTGR